MVLRSIGFFSMLFVAELVAAQEPVKPPQTPRIITATRQVSLFTGFEKQVLQAVQKKDKGTLQGMITDDCTMTFPKADPLDCGDWIESIVSREFTLKSFAVRKMSVTDLGDSALVNFERAQQATYKGRDVSGEFFVLDLWRKSGDSWRLVSRYVSKIETAAAATASPTPTGKE